MEEINLITHFNKSAKIVIAGSSQTGKTTLCSNIIKHHRFLFNDGLDIIFYFYNIYQPIYEKLKEYHPNIEFHKRLDFLEELLNKPKDFFSKNNVGIIFDDLQYELYDSPTVSRIFTVLSHHLPLVATIIICQSPIIKAKYQTVINRNANYFIFTNSKRTRGSLKYLGRDFYPEDTGKLLRVYDFAIEKSTQEYPYLICNFTGTSPEFYSGIFPGELFEFYQ